MNTTNINIISENNLFPYMIRYIPGGVDDYRFVSYIKTDKTVCFESELVRNVNTWSEQNINNSQTIKSKISTIRVYFPTYSVESYANNAKYILDLYTYLGEMRINLGSFLLDRNDALAAPRVEKYQSFEYFECIDVEVVDPYDLIYSDEFHKFRYDIKKSDINTDCSALQCSLHAVEKYNDYWIINSRYGGGQNSIDISKSVKDYLNYSITWIDNEDGVKIVGKLEFNEVYNDILIDYLKETYQFENDLVKIKYMLTTDNSVTWNEYESDSYEITHIFAKEDIKNFNQSMIENVVENWFADWDTWREGISFISTVIISEYDGSDFVDKIILKSNKIPITQNIFSKLIINDNINLLNEIDNDMNINIINTIQQSSVSYDIPENSKSNIIIPIFYKVRDLGNVVIHPEVNENICINLDAYKSRVESFILQVEGIKFNEIGTTSSGTIFKVIGANLPNQTPAGTFYILSQNGELITTGKYIYEV